MNVSSFVVLSKLKRSSSSIKLEATWLLRHTAIRAATSTLRSVSTEPEARPSLMQQETEVLRKPEMPGPEDCCQTGCVECVWEVYQRELLAYQRAVAVRNGLPPPTDPFEEMERQLYGTANDRATS